MGIGKKILGGVAAFLSLIMLLSVVFGSWYTIDQGERGVITRNGAVVGVAEPGLHFKLPLVDDVHKLDMQTITRTYKQMIAYSRDQQPAEMRMSVTYRLLPTAAAEIYERYGSADGVAQRLVDPRVFSETKVVFGQFNAVTAIQERTRLIAEISTAIESSIDGPLVVESVQLENIDFSDAYEKSIEERMLAEVEVQRLRQNAEREKVQAQIVVTQATAKADAVRQAASAEAEAIRLRGDAEADAINARGKALRDNPALIGLVQAERWDGKLPVTMIPGGAIPMLNVK